MRSLGPFQDLHDPPALELRERAGLLNTDTVADVEGVLLVVDVQARGAGHGLAVPRVRLAGDHRDDGGLVHATRCHLALADLAGVGPLFGGFGCHHFFSWASASAASISRARNSVS